MSQTLTWEVLPHTVYSPDLAAFDYHLFAFKGQQAVAEQRFGLYEDVKKWFDERQMGKIFTGVVFTNWPKDGKNV